MAPAVTSWHAARQIETELNSATDNPLLLGTPEAYRVVSQANPHGESVAMAADLLAIAVAELGGSPSGAWIAWSTRWSAACRRSWWASRESTRG